MDQRAPGGSYVADVVRWVADVLIVCFMTRKGKAEKVGGCPVLRAVIGVLSVKQGVPL